MSTDYNYDDKGQFFPYFILTMATLVTLPLTYSLLKPSKDLEKTASRIVSDYKPQHAEVIDSIKKKLKRRELKLKRLAAVVVGYFVIAWMVYFIAVAAPVAEKRWDPYDILGASTSSTEKQIKSIYRKLSLKYHPDKVKPDPAKNETLESLNEQWIEMSKAYKALTDDEVRNNYIQYGHPDGKQSFSIGIALPKLLVTEGNGKYVLLVYGLILGVLLPYTVGKWWYGTQRLTRDGVLVASAGNIFKEYDENLSEGDTLGVLSVGEEFKEAMPGDRGEIGSAKVERSIFSESKYSLFAGGMEVGDKDSLENLDHGVRRKALGLLWAYLARVDINEPTLEQEKFEVAPIAFALNESLLSISLAFGSAVPVISALHNSQNLIQAVPPNSSPLLQLPHVGPAILTDLMSDLPSDLVTLQDFMTLSEDKLRRLLVGPKRLTESQYKTAIGVAQRIPNLQVEKAFFKVTGERFITPGSLVQLVIKARIVPPGSKNVPPVNEKDLEDIDPEEGDVDAIIGRKGNKGVKANAGKSASPADADGSTPIQPPLAFAPYFARDHSPRWNVFLTDNKGAKMVVPPSTFTTFDKPLETADGKPTFAVQTLKLQFQAPPQAGHFQFLVHVMSDSYIGMDTTQEITLEVEDMAQAEQMAGDDEISEPDEDSLAGIIRGGGEPKKKKVEDSSDDESNTEEEEEEDSETDTDTDTDEE